MLYLLFSFTRWLILASQPVDVSVGARRTVTRKDATQLVLLHVFQPVDTAAKNPLVRIDRCGETAKIQSSGHRDTHKSGLLVSVSDARVYI